MRTTSRVLRKHRWNIFIGLGLVLSLWVGPYLYWRQKAIVIGFSSSYVSRNFFFPHWASSWAPTVFRPLMVADEWISGEQIGEIKIGSTANF